MKFTFPLPRVVVSMFSLNLSSTNEEPGSTQASARRVAPLSSRKSSRSQDIQVAKLDLHARDDDDGHQSTDYDSSLDDFDLLYDSYSERSSSDSQDGEEELSGSEEGPGEDTEDNIIGHSDRSDHRDERNDSDDSDDSDDGHDGHDGVDGVDSDDSDDSDDSNVTDDDSRVQNDKVDDKGGRTGDKPEVGRPPRLSLPSLEIPVATYDERPQRLETPESVRRVQFTASTSSGLEKAGTNETGKRAFKVELLTPCFDLLLSEGEDPATQVARKFAVGQERVRVLMHDKERVAVELLGSSFSLVKLEEKMAENASLHARVAELERKLTSSESLRLKAHQTLQELRREVDALEKFVCTKK